MNTKISPNNGFVSKQKRPRGAFFELAYLSEKYLSPFGVCTTNEYKIFVLLELSDDVYYSTPFNLYIVFFLKSIEKLFFYI